MVSAASELISEGRHPRLAVITDVAVERTAAGSLLLYRLLSDYPPDRLLAVDAGRDARWSGDRRLPGVTYLSIPYSTPRLARTRFNPAGPLAMTALAGTMAGRICAAVRPFAPEVVLTVTSNFLWIPSAAAARRLGVPLVLMLHDDWPSYQTNRRRGWAHDVVRWGCRRVIGRVYRQATARLCVSPGMEEQCRACFGTPGELLYPNRGADSPVAKVRVRPDREGGPVVAFCGHVHQDGTLTLLRELTGLLADMGGRLDLYTPHSTETLESWDLRPPFVQRVGFLAPQDMAERLGMTADVLFLPASFEPRERTDVATLFPSKLADYTAIGMPILIWGPGYSSAVRWALETPGVTEVVTSHNSVLVREALGRIISDHSHAMSLAERAVAAGERDFALGRVRGKFLSVLRAVVRDSDAI